MMEGMDQQQMMEGAANQIDEEDEEMDEESVHDPLTYRVVQNTQIFGMN